MHRALKDTVQVPRRQPSNTREEPSRNPSDRVFEEKFNPVCPDPSDQAAAAERLALVVAFCVALTALLVMAWKLASATSAACLAALWALS